MSEYEYIHAIIIGWIEFTCDHNEDHYYDYSYDWYDWEAAGDEDLPEKAMSVMKHIDKIITPARIAEYLEGTNP